MKGTIEEKILMLQEKKTALAQGALEVSDNNQKGKRTTKLNLADLKLLFSD